MPRPGCRGLQCLAAEGCGVWLRRVAVSAGFREEPPTLRLPAGVKGLQQKPQKMMSAGRMARTSLPMWLMSARVSLLRRGREGGNRWWV